MRTPWTHNETSLKKKPKQTNAWSHAPHAGPEYPPSFLNAVLTGMYHFVINTFYHYSKISETRDMV